MTVTDFLLPVFVEIFLIFVLLGLMARERGAAFKRGEVRPDDIALNNGNYPPRARQFANCFSNQFELPVLFFIAIAFILITRVGDVPLLVLAWIFVISRLVHAYIHVTSNIVPRRSLAYTVGAIALFIMWGYVAITILTGT